MKRGSVHDWGVAVGLFSKKPKDGLMRPVAPQSPVRRPQPARRATRIRSITHVQYRSESVNKSQAWCARVGRARRGRVEVGSCLISGGNFYFGNGLPAVGRQYMEEPALVDPKLPVDFAHPDWTGEGLHYWPSYGSISPSERAAVR